MVREWEPTPGLLACACRARSALQIRWRQQVSAVGKFTEGRRLAQIHVHSFSPMPCVLHAQPVVYIFHVHPYA
eukprot:828168-Pelagomonas_calceolata.AAC.1